MNTDGGKVTLYYNNDTSSEIDLTKEMVSGYVNSSSGAITLTVDYGGKQCEYSVTIIPDYYVICVEGNQYTVLTYGESVCAYLIIAYYSDANQFASVSTENVNLVSSETIEGYLKQGYCKVFLCNQYYVPLCESWSGMIR